MANRIMFNIASEIGTRLTGIEAVIVVGVTPKHEQALEYAARFEQGLA
jgi:hypothetical protein